MKARIIGLLFLIAVSATAIFADIPAPKSSSEIPGGDWKYIVMGIASGIIGAVLFFWLGRRNKRETK